MNAVVHILILAAGASRRMGGPDKLVLDAGGRPLLLRVVETALATGAPVIVTLAPTFPARRALLASLPLRLVEVPDAGLGMSRSLVRGAKAALSLTPAPDAGLMILPGDMPDLTTDALTRLIAEFRRYPSQILRAASDDGLPGHPVIFPRALWPDLMALTGDEGGRSILQRHGVRLLPLPGQMALTDLDTPKDLQRWRERNG